MIWRAWLTWVIYVPLIVISFRAARCNWLDWRAKRRLPIVTATPVEFSSLKPQWQLNNVRWPSPFGDQSLEIAPVAWEALARVAFTRHRVARYGSEGILWVSGAALGVQLPSLVQAAADYFTAWGNAGPDLLNPDMAKSLGAYYSHLPLLSLFIVPMLSLGGVVVGLALRAKADLFQDAERAYTWAATCTSSMPAGRHRA